MPKVFVESQNKTIEYEVGSNLMEILLAEDIFVDNPCNGKGLCGKCKVHILENAPAPTANEEAILSEEELADGIRLSCMVNPTEDIKVELLQKKRKHKVLTEGFMPDFEFKQAVVLEKGDNGEELYGVAIDIGTTTVVCSLINLRTGEEVSNASMINAQKHYGLDVLTRITYELEHPEDGVQNLKDAIVDSINDMIAEACRDAEVRIDEIHEIDVAANCTMMHTLLGVDATPLGRMPFTPVFVKAQHIKAAEVGIKAAEGAMLYCLPSVSAYIGADIVAGAYVCDLRHKDGNVLFIDIGTNGEIVLSRKGDLLCCSCAAGPALEGMNISSGMRAASGAIEDVVITEDDVKIKVIGDEEPAGVCGSGILAVVKELIKHGFVNPRGAFVKLNKIPEDDFRRKMLREDESGKREFVMTKEPELLITQSDVRQVQLAKGAILSGFKALLNKAGLDMSELDEVVIAGQFGAHLPAESMTGTGILPPEVGDRLTYVGNTSKTGAYMALMSTDCKREMEELAHHMEYLELGTTENYERLFAECLIFPKGE